MQFYVDKYATSFATFLSSFPEQYKQVEPEHASIIALHVQAKEFVKPNWCLQLPEHRNDVRILVFIEGVSDYKEGNKIFRLNKSSSLIYVGIPNPLNSLRGKGRFVRATALELIRKNKHLITESLDTVGSM